MTAKKTRPHVWKVQGELNHTQYIAWLRMKAQAAFREEAFEITFAEFQDLWRDHWHLRGRVKGSYCLTRLDHKEPWDRVNTVCITRAEAIAIHNRIEGRRLRRA